MLKFKIQSKKTNIKLLVALHSFIGRYLAFDRSNRSLLTWSVIALLIGVGLPSLAVTMLHHRQYSLDHVPTQLLVRSPASLNKLKETKTSFTYDQKAEVQGSPKRSLTVSTDSNQSPAVAYSAEISKKAAGGISFSDSEGSLGFKMIPRHALSAGRLDGGRVVYPEGLSSQHVYTYMRNGLKEDILLDQAPGDSAEYTWDLELGDKLEARKLDDGSIGIYSADPTLYGNLQISDAKSQQLVEKARRSSKRTSLAFVIPKPFINNVDGTRNYDDVSYKMEDGKTLTLQAKNLEKQKYPLSIDPSVAVTSSTDFQSKYFDDGMIDYSTANQIGRSNVSLGTVGTWSATTSFTGVGVFRQSVAYNGYLYVVGGYDGTNKLSDVQKAAINPADGTVGTWSATTSLSAGVTNHQIVAYNGYLYVVGGTGASGSLTTVQKAALNPADGTVGTWTTTTALSTARENHSSVVYNGFLYVLGGFSSTTSSFLNDVQKAAINADGTIGTWSATTSFTGTRSALATVAYNGYMYVIGGNNSGAVNDVQKAAINADGTIGTWSATTSFTTGRYGHAAIAVGGYMYVIAGTLASGSDGNDVQKAAINADGTIGTWSATSSVITTRSAFSAATYNGYLYVLGGATNGGSYKNDVQKTQITAGTPSFGAVGTQGPGTVTINALSPATVTGTGTTFSTTFAVGDSITLSGQPPRTISAIASNTSLTVSTNYTSSFAGTKTYTYFPRTSALPVGISNFASIAYNGFLYVLGGTDGSLVGLSDVRKAAINNDGTIGTWTSTTSFSGARQALSSVAYNGFIYIIAGSASGPFNDVQVAPINPTDGTIGTWTATASLPVNDISEHSSNVYNGFIYVIGGFTNGAGSLNTVYVAPINSDGTIGTWSTTTSMTAARSNHSSLAYNGYLYVLGGYDNINALRTVHKAPINSDGTIGSWVATTSFATTRLDLSATVFNGYMYVMGGANRAGTTAYNDVQVAAINSDGTVGSWSATTSFSVSRTVGSAVAYQGILYTMGGLQSGTTNISSDVQYTSIASPAQQATYERTIDVGSVAQTIDSITFNGTAVCGAQLSYKTAGSNGVFGSVTTLPFVMPGTTYTISAATQRYVWIHMELTDQNCGTNSNITDMTVNYTLSPPAAPTLSAPANSAVNQVLTPQFQLRTTDPENDYLRYKIEVCSTSNCSSIVRTIDQTSSQTGWTGQDTQTSTAYVGNSVITSSTMASHTYQSPPLSAGTQYWWRAYAIDPGGSGTISTASSINTFTTSATPAAPALTAPAANATGVSTTPLFQFRTTDANNDYLRYKLEVCSTSNCSSIVRTIDQTASQTGWTGQNQQANTAYTGNSVITSSTMANHTYQAAALSAGTQYWWRAYAIDPGGSNTFSSASSIQSFTTVVPQTAPAAPTLSFPASSMTGVPTLPEFRLSTTDTEGDFVKYKIEVCSTSNCSSVVRTIDQTASQTGWRSQDASSATAYNAQSVLSGSTLASHLYQTAALSANTQYWWRAYAIDPSGANTFSSASSISTFTTSNATNSNTIVGGTTIRGGSRVNN